MLDSWHVSTYEVQVRQPTVSTVFIDLRGKFVSSRVDHPRVAIDLRDGPHEINSAGHRRRNTSGVRACVPYAILPIVNFLCQSILSIRQPAVIHHLLSGLIALSKSGPLDLQWDERMET